MELLFFAISAAYSAAGFAGGSGFLLALTMTDAPLSSAAIAALVCNAASAVSVLLYTRQCAELLRQHSLIFVFGAIAAAAGATLSLDLGVFRALLGLCLAAAALCMLMRPGHAGGNRANSLSRFAQAAVGLTAGGVGGMTGIGGGVLLAVLLHFFFRTRFDQRRLSLLTGLFILINSVAGLAARLNSAPALPFVYPGLEMLAFSAFAGGALGRVLSQTLRDKTAGQLRAGAVALPGVAMIGSIL